ncbi:SET domain-containing protein-lysine N-methyltransferase [Candidatus Woesebacteria bacterium]|nr:SET domain-containing protein-lysine N-methyltransferase [Candidatus Woesebacteria bacterium]
MTNVEVKNSPIQGKGVYATKSFSVGELVLIIDDSHVVTDESTLTNDDNEFRADYFDNKIVLMQSPEVYINHSCDPNTYVKTIDGIRYVLAMKPIKVGDEITYDYSINGDNEGTFPCHCGSQKCRKVYQGNFFKLAIETQKGYIPYLDSWFTKKHSFEIEELKQKFK